MNAVWELERQYQPEIMHAKDGKQYWESVRKKSDAGKQLEKGMEMLLVTAEMKYGAKYAAELREKGYV